ncbi:cytochrome C [Bradyrhizobium sp. CCBAU 53340]|nr:cytochrome C [Bradyrhizobium sp. CCBAU 53340]
MPKAGGGMRRNSVLSLHGCAWSLVASFAALLVVLTISQPARALPSFAVQTGQPCAACHIGAFGPQLTPYGRDFKLHGYVASDGNDHGLPLAFTTQFSFTHTAQPQDGGAAPGFKPNDNFAVDQLSLYYAGKVTSNLGAFVELNFDGVAQQAKLNNMDVRYAKEGELFGQELLWGITANNSPTVQDPWNSTPVWGFPYNSSPLAPTPMATTLVDNSLGQRVLGVGAYSVWNNLLYLEGDVYKGLDRGVLRATGQVPDDSDQTSSFLPYARVALLKDWERHHVEVGAYMLSGSVVPGGGQTLGLPVRKTDVALDATYQFITDAAKVTSDRLSAHATYIHETASMAGSDALALGALPNHWLDVMRADVSYSFAATVTPSVQYFRTAGTSDGNYWGTANGSPNSDGMIFEVAYVPWGKPDSPFPNMNLRLAVQYVNYFRFDGTTAGASRNNNFYFSLWTAVKF